jgi:hypothetical protein
VIASMAEQKSSQIVVITISDVVISATAQRKEV